MTYEDTQSKSGTPRRRLPNDKSDARGRSDGTEPRSTGYVERKADDGGADKAGQGAGEGDRGVPSYIRKGIDGKNPSTSRRDGVVEDGSGDPFRI